MPASDTSHRAREIVTRIHRAQSAATKFWAAVEMSDFTHKLAEAGLRQRLGSSADADVRRILAETLYGPRTKRS
ncbi:MAG: hypothetical protein JOZ54_03315 [Acidobacteria bacterium]|nr:hypothetical protein [Acidobacteriota bacterium]